MYNVLENREIMSSPPPQVAPLSGTSSLPAMPHVNAHDQVVAGQSQVVAGQSQVGAVAAVRDRSLSVPADIPKKSVKISPIDQLKGGKYVATKIALLLPKLLLSGAGWAIGFALGGPLGAAIGDALGTFLGCALSLLIEAFIIQVILKQDLPENFWSDGVKSALILSAGSFVCGGVFAKALTVALSIVGKHATLAAKAGASALAGLFCGSAFFIGMTTARILYSASGGKRDEYSFNKQNLLNDLKLAFTIIFLAEMGFCATTVPFLGHAFIVANPRKITAQNVGSCAATVAIGGTVGLAPYELLPSAKGGKVLLKA